VRTVDASSQSPSPGLLQTIVFGRRPGWTLARVVFWVVALILVSRFILLPVRVQGISMMPTYRENGVNAINRLAYLRGTPQRGDVVAIRYSGHHIMLMKRVIALPGETIGFVNGRAFVNGQPLYEPYLKLPSSWNVPEVKLAPDEYFVVGDNRSMAPADHEFGRATRERILGKAVF
jgi:signal peptidase I